MGNTTVGQFALELTVSADELIARLTSAGVLKKSPSDPLSKTERDKLLEHSRRTASPMNAQKKSVVPRKQTIAIQQLDASGKSHTIQVEVRKRRPAVGNTFRSPVNSASRETGAKPKDVAEYLKWAETVLRSPFEHERTESIYTTNINNIFNALIRHPFFVQFSQISKSWQADYLDRTRTELFIDSDEPKLLTKPYKSVVEKTYRKNIVWNKNFPGEPKDGWCNHKNLYERFNDLVRGSLVCRFIDGPAFVADSILAYANGLGLDARQYTQERDDGYYAYHVYIKFPVTIIDEDWKKIDAAVEVEIQLTTQLQEVLRSLTHRFYESQRLISNPDKGKWKWEFSTSRFKVGYLSHTLHLLESVILEARDKVMADGNDSMDEK